MILSASCKTHITKTAVATYPPVEEWRDQELFIFGIGSINVVQRPWFL